MESITAGAPDLTAGRKRHRMDYAILFTVSLLCAFGLVMVFSASYYYAQNTANTNNDGYYYIRKQAIFLTIGYVAMIALTFFDYKRLEKYKLVGMIISVALLFLVLIFGREANGAKRWLVIAGQSIQPSEIAKFGMMLYMCAFMSKRHALMSSFKYGMLPMLLVVGMICGLVMLQPNMSMAVIIGMMGYALLYIGGCDGKQMLLLGLAAVGAFLLLAIVEPYRLARLTSFTNPWADPQGTGYQLIQSFYAIGSGGWFGRGLNNSRQKMLFMTYGESDFIFAIVCEELGFFGGFGIMLAYGFIIYRGIRVALRCRDRFGSLLASGIVVVFAIQIFVNIGVVTGTFPTTGQALPFISAGGSSMVIFLAAMGVLLNISRYTEGEMGSILRAAMRNVKRNRARRVNRRRAS